MTKSAITAAENMDAKVIFPPSSYLTLGEVLVQIQLESSAAEAKDLGSLSLQA